MSQEAVVGEEYVFVAAQVNENPDADTNHGKWIRVVAVDPGTREVAWSAVLAGTTGGTLAVANGQLYVNRGGINTDDSPSFSALDTADGTVKWTTDTLSSSAVPSVTDDLICIADLSMLRGIDPESGDQQWRIDLNGLSGVPDPTDASFLTAKSPVIYDDRIFLHLGQGWLVELN